MIFSVVDIRTSPTREADWQHQLSRPPRRHAEIHQQALAGPCRKAALASDKTSQSARWKRTAWLMMQSPANQSLQAFPC